MTSRIVTAALSLLALAVWLWPGNGRAHEAALLQSDLRGLGEKLFFDPRLSADGRTSCASCHQPAKAFQDGRRVAVGAFGQEGTRNTPSLLRVGDQNSLFWDGRRDRLENQALDPLLHEGEHGLRTEAALQVLLNRLEDYRDTLHPGREITTVRAALAAFERSLDDGTTPFERYLFGSDEEAIPAAARRGWLLFSGRAGCVECHQVGKREPALLTDHRFHEVVAPSREQAMSKIDMVKTFLALSAKGLDYSQAVVEQPALAELGRFIVTQDPKDLGRFKTPSLRNVAVTAPYMHDGRVATLTDAVELEVYYRSRSSGRPLILLDAEKADLVAFLESLTAEYLATPDSSQGQRTTSSTASKP
jgi:cytochrome c peroxidase